MKEIKLSPQVILVLQELRNQTKEPQEKLASLNNQFQNIIAAICLQEELSFEKHDIKLADDLSVLTVKEKEVVEEVVKPAKAKVKKM